MEDIIRLECDSTGRIKITDHLGKLKAISFSTPDSNGMEFNRLFNDIRNGDILELTFTNVRICRCCGKKLDKKKEQRKHGNTKTNSRSTKKAE